MHQNSFQQQADPNTANLLYDSLMLTEDVHTDCDNMSTTSTTVSNTSPEFCDLNILKSLEQVDVDAVSVYFPFQFQIAKINIFCI